MVSMLAFKGTMFTHTAGDEHDKRLFLFLLLLLLWRILVPSSGRPAGAIIALNRREAL